MGNKESVLALGSFRVNAPRLQKEGVLLQLPNQMQLAHSTDLKFKISSYEIGVFHIAGKYLGAPLVEVAFKHEYLIELLHGDPADARWRALAERYGFDRQRSTIAFGRCVALDVTRLLPYLYRRYAAQNLSAVGERMVVDSQFRRMETTSTRAERDSQRPSSEIWHEEDMAAAVAELEEVEKMLAGRGV
eukprot:UC1_evm3s635